MEAREIKKEVFNFYSRKFLEKWPSRPKLVNHRFHSLSSDISNTLKAPFTIKEITNAVWACVNEKALGLDGFSFQFINFFWDILKADILSCVKHFEMYEQLNTGCNSSFITLVPKIKDPLKPCDYRPIILIGCIYKIIVKSLANRLKGVIRHNIDEVQSTFLERRNILVGPLIVNELCSWEKKVKKQIMLFKANLIRHLTQ